MTITKDMFLQWEDCAESVATAEAAGEKLKTI